MFCSMLLLCLVQLSYNPSSSGLVGWMLGQCQSVTWSTTRCVRMHNSAAAANRRCCGATGGSSDTQAGYPLLLLKLEALFNLLIVTRFCVAVIIGHIISLVCLSVGSSVLF